MKYNDFKTESNGNHIITFVAMNKGVEKEEFVRCYPKDNTINGEDLLEGCLDGDDIQYQADLIGESNVIEVTTEENGTINIKTDFVLIPNEYKGEN